MPRLSVIMPAYNAEQTIKSAVSTTLKHLPADAELVVLDDASSDNTLRELEQLSMKDPRMVVHSEPRNLGAAKALQSLLLKTDSEFVARMDADDLVLPGRFRLQMASAQHGVDFTFMTVVHFRPQSKRLRSVLTPSLPLRLSAEVMPLHLLLVNPVAHSTMLARREAISALGGYRLVPAEDYDLWLRAAASGARMLRLATPGIAYRHHPKQVTASAQWLTAAAANHLTRQAHESLMRHITGIDYHVFDYLKGVHTQDGEEQFQQLRSELSQRARALPPVQRYGLLNTLRKVSSQRRNPAGSAAARLLEPEDS